MRVEVNKPSRWICADCMFPGIPRRELADHGYVGPTDPDGCCDACGEPVPETTQAVLIAKQVAAHDGSDGATPSDVAPVSPGMLYRLAEVAQAMRLDRSGKLALAIQAGLVRTVLVGHARRVPGDEFLRILREGLPDLPDARRPPIPKKARRTPRRKARLVTNGSINRIPL